MKKALLIPIVLILPIILTQTASAGFNYYVSVLGNDSNPGTLEQPFRTIQRAVDAAYAGDKVLIMGGIYNEQVVGKQSGAPNNWIEIRNYNNQEVIIDGTGQFTYGGVIHFTNQHHILFYGLTVRNSAQYGFFFPASDGPNTNNITVSHCNIYNCSMSGIYIYPYNTGYLAYDFIAEYNTIHDCQNGWYNHSIYNPNAFHFTSAITMKDLEELGGFDERYADGIGYDDMDLIARIRRKGMSVEIVDDPYVIHQAHTPTDYTNNQDLLTRNRNLYNTGRT